MRISVFGLGYVGTVTAACLAQKGHHVIGVDTNKTKVDIINEGRSPIIEKDVESLLSQGVKTGRIRATDDCRDAVCNSELTLICVGTPSMNNGSLDLTHLKRVCKDIAAALATKKSYHIVVVRSTVLPGTIEDVVVPVLEEGSGERAGIHFGVVSNPEFMRESTAVDDFYNPPKTIIGAFKEADAEMIASLYRGIDAPLVMTSIRVAEMTKYVDNTFHALKVSFANEIGNICKSLNIDSHEVMNIFCLDTKLNLSSYYLKPGFAFGGSCLPKDVRALNYKAKTLDLHLPILNAIMQSNEQQIKNSINRIASLGKKKIGILGFAFKAGTDDLREAPMVELIETLLGKGYSIKVYDNNVNLAKLFGANREYIEQKIPHLAELMVENIQEVVEHAEVIVIGNKSEEFIDVFPCLKEGQHIVDLVRITNNVETKAKYDGIGW
jgi:GDP-mannose 6-dehydrogenase